MRFNPLRKAITCAAIAPTLSFSLLPTLAQTANPGAITEGVKDPFRAVVSGAIVKVTNTATGVSCSTRTGGLKYGNLDGISKFPYFQALRVEEFVSSFPLNQRI